MADSSMMQHHEKKFAVKLLYNFLFFLEWRQLDMIGLLYV